MGNFWITFAISEAVSVVEAFVTSSKLSPAIKTILEELIAVGQKAIAALTGK